MYLNNIELTDVEITTIKTTLIDGLEYAQKEVKKWEEMYADSPLNVTRRKLYDAKERVERAELALAVFQQQIDQLGGHDQSEGQKTYYTLVVRVNGKWGPEFGSYDLDDVDDEMDAGKREGFKLKDMKIISTLDDQKSIDSKIAELNA